MKKKIAIVLFILVLVFGLVGCVSKTTHSGDNAKQYFMDLDVGIEKKSELNSGDWSISCKAVTKIEYKHSGKSTDNISLLMNSATFTNKTPIEKTSFNYGYPVGARYGVAQINSTSVNGKTAPNVLEDNELKIKLPKKVKKGEKLVLVIDYYIELPRCNMRYGYNAYTANFAQFYPQAMRIDEYSVVGDSFYSTADNYVVNIRYPSQYKCLASGTPSNREIVDGYNKVTYTAEKIRDFAFFIGLTGNIATKTENGLTVSYMYFNDAKPQARLDVAISAIKIFSEKFGDYGKSNFAIVSTPFAHGGMEYGDIITVNSGISHDGTLNNVLVHEIAHQWWYGAVGSDQVNHAWQDEGLTEFSVYLYQLETSKNANLEGNYLWQAKKSFESYRNKLDLLGVPIDDHMDRPLSDYLNTDEYVYSAYDKGMLMFNSVYETMGEKLFLEAIQDYFKTYKGKLTTPQDLYDVFDKHHVGISEVLKVWLNGSVMCCL